MRFLTVVLTAVTAFTALVSAQSSTETSPPAPAVTDSKDNQINYPVGGTIGSGSPVTIKWSVELSIWEFGFGGTCTNNGVTGLHLLKAQLPLF